MSMLIITNIILIANDIYTEWYSPMPAVGYVSIEPTQYIVIFNTLKSSS